VKSKKSLVFVELISKILVESGEIFPEESPNNGHLFLISSLDPWYCDILVNLQNLHYPSSASLDEC